MMKTQTPAEASKSQVEGSGTAAASGVEGAVGLIKSVDQLQASHDPLINDRSENPTGELNQFTDAKLDDPATS